MVPEPSLFDAGQGAPADPTHQSQDRGHDHDQRDGQVDTLLNDIFARTGCKVTHDDPIVVAALFQASLMRQAGDAAAAKLTKALTKGVAELALAVKTEREQAANLDQTIARAFQQIADGAKRVGDQELSTLQTRVARMASDTLDQVRRTAKTPTSAGVAWLLAVALLAGLAAGMALGIVIANARMPTVSNDQLRLMHNGMLLDAAWESLPKAAREILESKRAVASGKPETRNKASLKD